MRLKPHLQAKGLTFAPLHGHVWDAITIAPVALHIIVTVAGVASIRRNTLRYCALQGNYSVALDE